MPAGKLLELRFPAAGVGRRRGHREAALAGPPYQTPWAVNMRLEDPLDRRLRGGSRPGLTKFLDAAVGTTIAEMVPIRVSSSTAGAEELLVVLVDSTLSVVDSGVLSVPVGRLLTEAGDYVVTEAGARILVGDASAPATAFLVVGKQHVYVITSTAVKQFNPKTGALTTLTPSSGAVPTGCTFGAVYRDRLVLAGGDNTVHISRQGDFTDFVCGANLSDGRRPLQLQLSSASQVGELATAAVPHVDAALLLASARSLWVVRGDPAAGGSMQNVSRSVGIVAPRAWCSVEGQVVFLAEDGLWVVGSDGSGLASLSDDRLPEELRAIDTSTTSVLMGYDHDARGVHLYLRTTYGPDTHWFFGLDGEKRGFWPMRFDDHDHAPVAVCQYGGDLLLGGGDGYIRSVGGTDDDGEDIESHLLVGPVRLGGANDFGLIQNLHGMVGTGSGTVNWRIVTGETAEEAAANGKAAIEAFQAGTSYSSYVKASGSWSAGRSLTSYPRVQAMWACLWLQSTDQWAYENVTMETIPSGRWR